MSKTMERTNPLPRETCGDPNSNEYWTQLDAILSALAVRQGYEKFKMEERKREKHGE